MKRNILVTGGAGYVGSVVVPLLLSWGDKVTVLDDLSTNDGAHLFRFANNPDFKFICEDIRNTDWCKKNLHFYDVVVHLAAVVGFPACDREPLRAATVNVGGTANIVNYLSPRQRLIYASTIVVYGPGAERCTEDTPLDPQTHYAATKAEGERIALSRPRNTVALRFSTAFGVPACPRWDLLPHDLTLTAYRTRKLTVYEGNALRSFVHVQDMANMIQFFVNRDDGLSSAYNVGFDALHYTKLDLCRMIQDALPGTEVIEARNQQDPDKRNFFVSHAKLYRRTELFASRNLRDGIAEVLRMAPLVAHRTAS